jgi:flotillin
MAAIDNLTVISTDGAGALPKQVTANLVQTMSMLKSTTGIDLQEIVARYAGGSPASVTPAPAPAAAPVNAPAAAPAAASTTATPATSA